MCRCVFVCVCVSVCPMCNGKEPQQFLPFTSMFFVSLNEWISVHISTCRRHTPCSMLYSVLLTSYVVLAPPHNPPPLPQCIVSGAGDWSQSPITPKATNPPTHLYQCNAQTPPQKQNNGEKTFNDRIAISGIEQNSVDYYWMKWETATFLRVFLLLKLAALAVSLCGCVCVCVCVYGNEMHPSYLSDLIEFSPRPCDLLH